MQHLFNIATQAAKIAAFWLITTTPGVVSDYPSFRTQPAEISLLIEVQLPPSNPRRR